MICAVGVLVFAAYAHPGFMSFDSAWQLKEGRAGQYSDWHPPAMAAIWGVLDRIVKGPLLMLVLQAGAFAAGVLVLVRKRRSLNTALIATGTLLVFPPIATTLAVIRKDSQMLGLVMLGTALIAPPASVRTRVAGVCVLALATAMRHNAFTVTLAIVVGLLELPARTRLRRYAAAAAVWIAITIAAFGANRLLTDNAMHPWHGSLAVFDVLGTLHFAGPLSDAEIRDTLRGTHFDDTPPLQHRVDSAYSPFFGIFRDFRVHFIDQPATDAERTAMARAFRSAVLAHPFAYLWHRASAFREVLQLYRRHFDRVWTGYDRWAGYSHTPGAVQAWLIGWAHRTDDTFLYFPYLYLIAVCLAGAYAIRRRDRLLVVLVASALISELSLFVIAPTPDFRYSIWLVLVAVLVPWLRTPTDSGRLHHQGAGL
ncbi:MAG TPA: hypothetical protein VLT45_24680 [Kofleriaceae bacterium]|nr:hypothetical protein [Kofleriaceae bacterium]